MFSLFFLLFPTTWEAHMTFFLQTWNDAAFSQLLGISLLRYCCSFAPVWRIRMVSILSYPFIKSWVECAGFCKHPLPPELSSVNTFGLCSLDTSLFFTHHNYPSLLLLPPFISVLFSFLRPRFNSIVEKTTSVSLTSSWLFMGERKSPFFYLIQQTKLQPSSCDASHSHSCFQLWQIKYNRDSTCAKEGSDSCNGKENAQCVWWVFPLLDLKWCILHVWLKWYWRKKKKNSIVSISIGCSTGWTVKARSPGSHTKSFSTGQTLKLPGVKVYLWNVIRALRKKWNSPEWNKG